MCVNLLTSLSSTTPQSLRMIPMIRYIIDGSTALKQMIKLWSMYTFCHSPYAHTAFGIGSSLLVQGFQFFIGKADDLYLFDITDRTVIVGLFGRRSGDRLKRSNFVSLFHLYSSVSLPSRFSAMKRIPTMMIMAIHMMIAAAVSFALSRCENMLFMKF